MSRYEDEQHTEEIELRKYIHKLKQAAYNIARDNIQIDYGTLRNNMARININKQTTKPYRRVLCKGCNNNGYDCARCHGEGYIDIPVKVNADKTIRMYKFCYSCGDELPENAYYCIMCGTQIRNE